MSIHNYKDKLKRYFWFSSAELKTFAIVAIALAVISSWSEWGIAQFDAGTGLHNLLVSLIAIILVVFVHHAAQRLVGLYEGFKIEQKLWWHGLLIGLILVMASGGKVKFLAATATLAHLLPVHRIGMHRYGANISTLNKIIIVGPLANVAFAVLIHTATAAGLLAGPFWVKLFSLNLWFAVCNLLPIPQLDGAYVFYFSRPLYVFLFASTAAYGLLALVYNLWSFAIAAVAGSLIAALFYWIWEAKW